MRLTVLGGCGAWPAAGQACSGYLIEDGGFRLLVDPGYATVPRLLEHVDAAEVDAVLVSHEHPDHCADLNPLLRARVLRDDPPSALPVHALPGAVDAVLALDDNVLGERHACDVHPFGDGDRLAIGPFTVDVRLLPHFVPNAGFRIAASDAVLAYTGDCGPDPGVVEIARDADVLLAEATHVDDVGDSAGALSTAHDVAREADQAGVRRLVLTHLFPGEDPAAAATAAREHYAGPIDVARPGLTIEI